MQNPGRKTAFSGEWRNALGLIKSAGQGHRIAEQELNVHTGQGKPRKPCPGGRALRDRTIIADAGSMT